MSTNPAQRLLEEGVAHHRAGRLSEAALRYEKLRTLVPRSWEGHHYGGMLALLRGDSKDAVVLFTRALAINPKSVDSAMALGVAQLAGGNADAAEISLRHALRLDSKNSEALDNLALVLRSRARIEEAIECHEKSVNQRPRRAEGWFNYGITLLSTEAVSRASDCFTKALQLEPKHYGARSGSAVCLYRNHRVQEAIALYGALLRENPSDHIVRSYRLLALNNIPGLSREELYAEHLEYGKHIGPALRDFRNRLDDSDRTLRVGFLSADLREHSVAYFLRPLLRGLDTARFEVTLFHDHARLDAMSGELRSLVQHWINVGGQTDGEVEAKILGASLDVFFDLAGHTGNNRLAIVARRLAPVQISYLGYPNTTGVSSVDFRFVDAITDPDGIADKFHSESLIRFAPTAWCYEPQQDIGNPKEAPRVCNGHVTFGCFNNFSKITDEILAEWRKLLQLVPESRLILKSPGLETKIVSEHLTARLADAGIGLERIQLHGLTTTHREHMEAYSKIDVALDTFPYHGTTTTCEALWMGVPVVVLAGNSHVSRVGVSLLHAVGRADWIAANWDEYRMIAARIALDDKGSSLGAREALRMDLANCCLMDRVGQSRRFWDAIRACWRSKVLNSGCS